MDTLKHLAVDVVESTPGLWVQRAIDILSQRHQISSKTLVTVLRQLSEEGAVERRTWRGRHWLFPRRDDLDDWWLQVAALQKKELRTLFDLVADEPRDCSQICGEAKQRFDWPPSTTRDRLKMLMDAELVSLDGRPGRRRVPLMVVELHPSTKEALRYKRDNHLRLKPMVSENG